MRTPRTRRRLLAGLLLGFGVMAFVQRPRTLAREPGLVAMPPTQTPQDVQTRNVAADTVDTYLAIAADGQVTVRVGKVELGTGIATALAQIVAEELDVPLDRVTLVQGDTATTPDQGTTAGSKSLQVAGPLLRQAAAEARRILLDRASEKLGVPVDRLRVADGVVRSDAGSVAYGELAGKPFDHPVTGDAPVKASADYRVVGQSIPRRDLLAKLTGGEAFVHDVRLEGMLHGRVVRPRVRTRDGIGASVVAVDDGALKDIAGVIAVVRNGDFVGVVAEREEQAVAAARALNVTWSALPELPAQADEHARLRAMPSETRVPVNAGDLEAAFATAAVTHAATFDQPWQAHASMGPSCAVADVRADGATIYASSQNVYALARSLASLLGLAPERVRVIYREGSGCYGHNGADDVSADAALLSRAVGRPVRVQWMREDEFAWEPKGPAMTSDIRAGLDAGGNIVAWDYRVWTPTHGTRPGGEPSRLLAAQLIDPPVAPAPYGQVGGDRNAPTIYTVPNNRVTVEWVSSPTLRQSSLRSLGGFHNTTANEIFMDELARLASADPVAFRLRHLVDPRAVDVLQRVVERAGWGGPLPERSDGRLTGRGVAFARYETAFAYVATVAEVAVDPASGAVRVERVVVAHDCGAIVNPDGLTNQIEGNVIQGISRALLEEVTWDRHEVTSLTWADYHILTFPDVPEIEVILIDRPGEPSWGAGEPAICPMAAAVSNAICDATGARLRAIPYTPERVLAAIRNG